MRSTLLPITVLGGALILCNTAVNADPLPDSMTTTVPTAPIGHLQPRAQRFVPRSPGEQGEQQQLSIFDAQQQKLDKELDEKLNICSGC